MFRNTTHQKAFEKQINLYQKHSYVLSNKFIAVVFILTADPFIWKASKNLIKPNIIDFPSINIRGIETDSYMLFKVAKEIYYKHRQVSVSELADKTLTKEYIFKTTINALIIARYGYNSNFDLQ